MIHQDKQPGVERAKTLLRSITNAAMATVNEDNTPHNSPYFFMASHDLTELYWGSHPDSLHSANIRRTGRLFVVLYESDRGGGLYIEAIEGRIAFDEELGRALRRHNELRQAGGREPFTSAYYQPPQEQRMWVARTSRFWINHNEKDASGHLRRDYRAEVSRDELLR